MLTGSLSFMPRLFDVHEYFNDIIQRRANSRLVVKVLKGIFKSVRLSDRSTPFRALTTDCTRDNLSIYIFLLC